MIYMTQISRDDVLKLALLSGIQLADDEIENLQNDIPGILDYVKLLDELDTTDVEPVYQVTGLQNVFRLDVVEASTVGREQLLELAPDTLDFQVKVPKVL